ncbi:acylneuraminate cytidylyltransferase family protein [Anaerosporobacter faecicola]|uniref:acylneuraminate cytidylyltransferase family protein n=1 Tax=Anaerosporobacter faecicola TaxID=2718714 RepID=UPI00143AA6D2|nr:acylneuraminate cytidylyltransferase family protein [Anaerosporobacter faecicola]
MKKSLCVIPARSGSKGLKDKNILDLCGKPVLAYTIEACKESEIFDDVFVITDSEEYADIARSYGAEIPFMESKEMAGDLVSSAEPLLYCYDYLKRDYKLMWLFQPTSPLKMADDIVNAYKVFESNKYCEFVLSTTEIDPHYFHWALEDLNSGMSEMYFGKKMLKDRTELSPVYRPNGAIKVGVTDSVIRWRHFFGDNIVRTTMPEERSIHIRNQFDLDMCEMLLKKRGM